MQLPALLQKGLLKKVVVVNSKKAKAIRKAAQYDTRQTIEVFNLVMERQLAQPFKLRCLTALKILIGKKDVKQN